MALAPAYSLAHLDSDGLPDFAIRRQASETLNLPYVATKRQLVAHLHPSCHFTLPLLYGGAVGGGKSTFLWGEGIRECREVPGNQGFICRYENQTFMDTTFKHGEKLMAPLIASGEVIHQPGRRRYLWRHTGSWLQYGGLRGSRPSSEDPFARIKTQEFGFVGIDEATDVPYDYFYTLQGRVRWTPAEGRYKVRLTCNPEPGWIKEKFWSEPEDGWEIVQALPHDNPHLPPDYIEGLRKTWPENVFNAWVLGDWDAFTPTNAEIPAWMIREAMRRDDLVPDWNDCVWALDCADTGEDKSVLTQRAGNVFDVLMVWEKEQLDDVADACIGIWERAEQKPQHWFIDDAGIGRGTARLIQRAASRRVIRGTMVQGISNGMKATDRAYTNLGTELGQRLYQRMRDELCQMPNGHSWAEQLRLELEAGRYEVKGGVMRFMKEVAKKQIGHSPDFADSCKMLMADKQFVYAHRRGDPADAAMEKALALEPDLEQRERQRAMLLKARAREKQMREMLRNQGMGGFDYDV